MPAPCAISLLHPALKASVTLPGTANTSLPCSSAKSAVIREPLFFLCLYHQYNIRQGTDNPVPHGEVSPKGFCTLREFRYQSPARYRFIYVPIAGRITDIDSASKHGVSWSARFQRSAVCTPRPPLRHSADNRHSMSGQHTRELLCLNPTILAAHPCPTIATAASRPGSSLLQKVPWASRCIPSVFRDTPAFPSLHTANLIFHFRILPDFSSRLR